jgi:hypothetical protein
MPLKILKESDQLEVSQITLVVYAPPGVGKTSLGFTADAPLLLDFDKGAHRSRNRKDTVQVESWSDVASIGADDLRAYKTLVMDTAGRALDALTVDIIASNPKLGRGGALTLQGYGELKARFIAYTKLIRSFGLDIVLLAHSDEQRNGDDVIERLDVQGGSKNEIYKAADVMGRLAIKQGKRVLNFNPTDTAFGKNPAGFPELAVPDFSVEPTFLASVMSNTKAALNMETAAQQKVTSELADWQAKFDELAINPDAFNNMAKEVAAKASDAVKANAGRLLVKIGRAKGLAFEAKAKTFSAKQTEQAAA